MPTVQDLRVESIVVGKRLRPLNPAVVAELMESMATVGLIQPVIIARNPKGIVPRLVAGAHRLASAKGLGWETIPCLEHAGTEEDDKMLVEIDENLVRTNLSPAERAMHIAARKEIYERRHPETAHGATGRGRNREPNSGPLSFADETAAKSRRSKSSVKADATRARRIPQIADVIGTTLDSGAELDALGKLPPAAQADLIAKAKAGQAVSAQPAPVPPVAGTPAPDMPPDDDATDTAMRWRNQFESHWLVAGRADREWALRYVLADMNAHKVR